MSVSTFIPTLWAARIMANLNNVHVFTDPIIANRDYEGDIRQMGDKVKINSIGRITIRSYSRGSSITAPETLNTARSWRWNRASISTSRLTTSTGRRPSTAAR